VGAAAKVGAAMICGRVNARRRVGVAAAVLVASIAMASPALAGDHYAVVITGAAGGDQYAMKYDTWRTKLVTLFREKLAFDEDHLFVLADHESAGVAIADREHVQKVFGDIRKRAGKDDLLIVILIGHGTTTDGDEAKFNLVGPDLSSSQWADLLKPFPGRLAFVDTTAASSPFLRHLAAKGHAVVTATDTSAQQFETVFPEFFIRAFEDPEADLDRNGRVSLWEAFAYASAGVHQYFEQKGQLPTERPVMDDDGDGIGREAQNPGSDGRLAKTIYLENDAIAATGNSALDALLRRQADLQQQLEALKARKAAMPQEQYELELERLLLELARVSQQIRTRS
jgi:hypothetical protein